MPNTSVPEQAPRNEPRIAPHSIGHAAWPGRPDPVPDAPGEAPLPLTPAAPPGAAEAEPAQPSPARRSGLGLAATAGGSVLALLAGATLAWWLRNRTREPAVEQRTRERLTRDYGVPTAADIRIA